MRCNQDIRDYARTKKVYLYEVATACGVSEPTIMRKLRVEMTDEEKREIYATIDRLAAKHVSQIVAAAAQ